MVKPTKKDGCIINAMELTADQVAGAVVLCPLCRKKQFEKWPLGWDAHAIGDKNPCDLPKKHDKERKREYKTRLLHLFKDKNLAKYK